MFTIIVYFSILVLIIWLLKKNIKPYSKITFEEMCLSSNRITILWGGFFGHIIDDKGNKILYTKTDLELINKASKYNMFPIIYGKNSIILTKII